MTRVHQTSQHTKPTPHNEPPTVIEPSRDAIATRAYELYLERGGVDGGDVEDWLQAERDLREREHPD